MNYKKTLSLGATLLSFVMGILIGYVLVKCDMQINKTPTTDVNTKEISGEF